MWVALPQQSPAIVGQQSPAHRGSQQCNNPLCIQLHTMTAGACPHGFRTLQRSLLSRIASRPQSPAYVASHLCGSPLSTQVFGTAAFLCPHWFPPPQRSPAHVGFHHGHNPPPTWVSTTDAIPCPGGFPPRQLSFPMWIPTTATVSCPRGFPPRQPLPTSVAPTAAPPPHRRLGGLRGTRRQGWGPGTPRWGAAPLQAPPVPPAIAAPQSGPGTTIHSPSTRGRCP